MDNNFEQKLNVLRQDFAGLNYIVDEINELAARYNNNVQEIKKGLVEFEKEVAEASKQNVVQADGVLVDYTTFSKILTVLLAAKEYHLCEEELVDKLIDMGKDQAKKPNKENVNNIKDIKEHKCSCDGKCSNKEQEKEEPKGFKIDIEENADESRQDYNEYFAGSLIENILKGVFSKAVPIFINPNTPEGKELIERMKKNGNNFPF